MIVCGTGHRPEDCEDEQFVRIKSRLKLASTDKDVEAYITGMAAGFDLWSADEIYTELGIPLICAVPWKGHTARKEDEELYAHILSVAEEVVYVNESEDYPGPWAYQTRNEWMVDHANLVMAYLNPNKTRGGTVNCYNYAKKVGKPIANIWYDPPF